MGNLATKNAAVNVSLETPVTVAQLDDRFKLSFGYLTGSEVGLYDTPEGVAIPYFDESGLPIEIKLRTAMRATDGSYWPKGRPLVGYGRWLSWWGAKAGFVIFGEGESDGWCCWSKSVPFFGVPGWAGTKTITAESLVGVDRIYVAHEPDQGGEKFVPGVRARLRTLGYRGRLFELSMPAGIKDLADLHIADPDRFLDRLRERILTAPQIPVWQTKTEVFLDDIAADPKGRAKLVEMLRPEISRLLLADRQIRESILGLIAGPVADAVAAAVGEAVTV